MGIKSTLSSFNFQILRAFKRKTLRNASKSKGRASPSAIQKMSLAVESSPVENPQLPETQLRENEPVSPSIEPEYRSETEVHVPAFQSLTSPPPIFLLPPEVLSSIFSIVSDAEYEHENARCPRYSSQVCRHWRDVALGCPTLWARITNINKGSIEWIQELLYRSKDASLVVKGFVVNDRKLTAKLFATLEHFARIETCELVIFSSSPVIDDTLWQVLLQPAPCLKSFQINDPRGVLFDSIAPQILFPLFSQKASMLRSLRFRNLPLDVKSPVLQNLVCLEVETVLFKLAPTIAEWLDLLVTMNSLERLSLIDVFPDEELADEERISLRDVHLPHLSFINVSGRLAQCILFLGHLYSLSPCSLQLSCTETRSRRPSDFTAMENIITSMLRNWPIDHTSSSLEVLITSEILYACNDPDVGWESSLSRRRPAFELTLSWTDTEEESALLFAFMRSLKAAHLYNVATLRLDVISTRDIQGPFREIFLDFVKLLTSLVSIKLSSRAMKFLLPLLEEYSRPEWLSKDGLPPNVLLPSLRTIILDTVLCPAATVVCLATFLQWRQKIEAPVHVVDITICCSQEKLVQGLGKIVDLTLVDGGPRWKYQADSTTSSVVSEIVVDDGKDDESGESSESSNSSSSSSSSYW